MIDVAPETLDLLAFIDASPTPWHCVATAAARLETAGFAALDEREGWGLGPGDGGYLVRDGALIAVRLGTRPPMESGFRLIGAHTDSPGLRLKPSPEVDKAGYRTLGCEVYGGALYHSWLDRDLGIAGRIFLRGMNAVPDMRLVHIAKALCRIPSLAIHLNRDVNTDGLKLNPQTQLVPLFGMAPPKKKAGAGAEEEGAVQSALKAVLADAAGVAADAILGWDLALVDTLPSAVGGFDDAFVFAPRLDNQASCHAGLSALLRAGADAGGDGRTNAATQVVCLYDHEEVGSLTTAGADGPLVERLLARLATGAAWGAKIAEAGSDAETLQRAIARSWHVSADMAHAVHPNYEDKHEPQHKPVLNGGPVIKSNSNQRYATTGETAALFEALCGEAGVPVQKFVTRTDLACGTTIGPIAGGKLGVRTVDVGNPMLSMHSAREQCGAHDVARMIAVLTRFLRL